MIGAKIKGDKEMKHIWVIEILYYDVWEPVGVQYWDDAGMFTTLKDARKEKLGWQKDRPDDKFRIRKYMPVEKG